MNTFLGNCCLGLAALVFGTIVTLILNHKPPIGGNGGANPYGMVVLLFHACALILMAISAISIGQNGGFDWISDYRMVRWVAVVGGLLMVMVPILYASIELETPTSGTALTRLLSRIVIITFPMILVGTGLVLLNAPIRQICPAFLWKWPLLIAAAAGLVMTTLGLYEWWDNSKKTKVELQSAYENSPPVKAMRLQEIREAEMPGDMLRILEMVRIAYPDEVREAAVAKIKSSADWPQKLLLYMENDYAREVIGFLAYNDVPDKKQFADPLQKGLLHLADWIRHSIQGTSPSSFSVHEYSDEVNCALLAIERFEGLGIDYRPAVQALRSALDEQLSRGTKPFAASAILDAWLVKHPK